MIERRLSLSSRSTTTKPLAITKRQIIRLFKIRGLSLQLSSIDAIENVLSREPSAQQVEKLELLLKQVKQQCTTSNIVSPSILANVVASMSASEKDVLNESLELLQSFDTPQLYYDNMNKAFDLLRNKTRELHAPALSKVEMMQQRFLLLQQRLLRQDFFRPKLVSANQPPHASLTPVEALLGRTGIHYLVGVLTQIEEGRYYCEDLTGNIPIAFDSSQVLSDGFITEGCVVVLEGEMQDGIFLVYKIGHPPPESRQESIQLIGYPKCDLFNAFQSSLALNQLRQMEITNGNNGMFCVLSNVYLDLPSVMSKLDQLFNGFQHVSPLPLFLFMGNFTCRHYKSINEYAGYFQELSNVIQKYPDICENARFVFVPGPTDVTTTAKNLFPQAPLPKYVTKVFKKLKHASFGTNPCRIRYFSKEFLIFRHDVVSALKHSSLLSCRTSDSSEKSDNLKHAIQTMFDQGHLLPSSSNIFWDYDHALRMYPLSDALILGADSNMGQYYDSYVDCDVVIPGSFPESSGFIVYRPVVVDEDDEVRSDVEFSQVD